jgi:hypothetical protein
MTGQFTARKWLRQLARGRSFITNGPLLEFTAGARGPGDVVRLASPAELTLHARAQGRVDFRGLELIYNGRVIHSVRTREAGGHFEAKLDLPVRLQEPGWLGLRVPLQAGKNELGQPLFAHTSPIYVEIAGRSIFQPDVARELLREMQDSMEMIKSKARFEGKQEEDEVLTVYRRAIHELRLRLAPDHD